MTCPECDKDLLAFPCSCGYQPKELQVQPWMILTCATPGCFTAIRVRAGEQEGQSLCKWCQRGESHALIGKSAIDIRLKGVES